MSITDLVHEYLPDDAIVLLSSALGEPPQRTHAAIKATVPVLLRMYAYKASHPDGPEALASSVRRHAPLSDARSLERCSKEEATEYAHHGYQPLLHLFDRETLDGLSNTISRFSGISLAAARPLIGAVNSATLSVLARYSNPDQPTDLAFFLDTNTAAIESGIPEGLHEYLAEFPQLRDVTEPQYDAGAPATADDMAMENEAEIPRQENYHNERYYEKDQAMGIPGSLAWVVPAIVILVIGAALLFTIAPRNNSDVSERVAVAPPPVVDEGIDTDDAQPAGANVRPVSPFAQLRTPADTELPHQLEAAVNQLMVALPAQNDRAQKELEAVHTKLNDLSPRVVKLPANERRDVSAALQNVLPSIRSAMPQVPEGSRSTVGQIIQQLERMTGQQPTT